MLHLIERSILLEPQNYGFIAWLSCIYVKTNHIFLPYAFIYQPTNGCKDTKSSQTWQNNRDDTNQFGPCTKLVWCFSRITNIAKGIFHICNVVSSQEKIQSLTEQKYVLNLTVIWYELFQGINWYMNMYIVHDCYY